MADAVKQVKSNHSTSDMVKIVADEVVKEVNSIQSKVQVSYDPKIQEKFPEDFDIKNEVKLD